MKEEKRNKAAFNTAVLNATDLGFRVRIRVSVRVGFIRDGSIKCDFISFFFFHTAV